jgi:predicted ester cyclase
MLSSGASPAETLIRKYYDDFNERRLSDLATRFDDDAIVEHMPRRPVQRGGEGYLQFVNVWIAAFPDAAFVIEQIVPRGTHTHEVTLLATGTHEGALELGGWIFRPTRARVALHLREVLEVRDGKIVFSTTSFDLQQMIEQLTRVDSAKLLKHLEHLRELGGQLPAAERDAARTRDILDRIGRELDAARHIVRPYYR